MKKSEDLLENEELRQVEIPVIFDEDRMIYQCGRCGYTIECNFKDKVDLMDFLECLLAHECYVSGE